MISPFATIFGVGVACAILLFFAFNIDDKEHFILRLLAIIFVIILTVLIPKAAMDASTECETVVSNSTDVSATVTSYEYESFCYVREETTGKTFYKVMLGFIVLFFIYILVYLGYYGLEHLKDSFQNKRQ